MRKIRLYQIDTFTDKLFMGNPAGVIVNADCLEEQEMQLIARELNNSETAFIFSTHDDDCDGAIRYFTPTIEVPVCGHATIAAIYARGLEENLDSCVLRMRTGAGILPVKLVKGHDFRIIMTQGRFELDSIPDNATVQRIIDALGLKPDDLESRCPVQIASTGHSKVMIGIKSRNRLNEISPDFARLAGLSRIINCNGYFVFTIDSEGPDIISFGRMFAPAIGINEDPVTGNANGPLGGYIVKNKIVKHDGMRLQFLGTQGEKMGRPGAIKVIVDIENDEPARIQIEGIAKLVYKTEIILE